MDSSPLSEKNSNRKILTRKPKAAAQVLSYLPSTKLHSTLIGTILPMRLAKIFSIATLILGLATIASAGPVAFTSSGYFSTSSSAVSGSSSVSFSQGGGSKQATITFTGVSLADITSATGAFSLGTFNVNTTAGTGEITIPSSHYFYLVISQTDPSAPNVTTQATLAGKIHVNDTTGVPTIDFSSGGFTAGGVNYTFTGANYNATTFTFTLANESCGTSPPTVTCSGANTSIQATLDFRIVVNDPEPTTTPVPEPASMILLGSGFVGAARMLRRRMKR